MAEARDPDGVRVELIPSSRAACDPGVTAYLDSEHAALVQHTPAWAAVLARAYPSFRPRHLVARLDDEVAGLLPVLELRSLTGVRRLTTQPFNFYAGPLARTPEVAAALVDALVALAADSSAVTVQGHALLDADLVHRTRLEPASGYVRQVVELAGSHEDVRRGYGARLRTRCRALARQPGRVVRPVGPAAARAVHDLVASAYGRRHGTLAQPRRFFDALLAEADGWLEVLALEGSGGTLTGAVVLTHRPAHVGYLFGAARPGWEQTSPLARLLDHAVGDACARGARWLDLGLTSPTHEGLLRFKASFGARREPLGFYRRTLRGAASPLADYHRAHGWARPLLRRTPVPMLAALSAVAARWLA